jgi:hypothetical protein
VVTLPLLFTPAASNAGVGYAPENTELLHVKCRQEQLAAKGYT